MAKTKISEFDVDPSNNTDINSINIAEGCAPSGINNAIRQLMSDLKEQQTGASGDSFTVGGNLAVTGTSTFTGATTFSGAVVFSSTISGLNGKTIDNATLTNVASLSLEGTTANVPPQGGRKHPDQKMIAINTENILFICGGAFEGIDKQIARRMQTQAIGFKNQVGNKADETNYLQYISPADLRNFGLIPEIIGRLPVLCHLNPLDRDTLHRILVEPKNALIKQYIKMFELEGIKLTISNDIINLIVDTAFELKLGARGLRSICENIMTDYMYDAPSNKEKELSISLEVANAKLESIKYKSIKAA